MTHEVGGVKVAALFTALALTASLSAWVERQFFYPDRTAYTAPPQFGLNAEDAWIEGPQGARLHGWWFAARGPAHGTVLHLHGNAGNISAHLSLVAWLPYAGFNLLAFDYRGFGRSEGEPTLDGVVEDAGAALEWVRRRPDVDAQRLVVLGQSMGGATAVRLLAADSRGVRLLVLDCAFSSYRGIARDAVGGSWLRWIAPAALQVLPGDDRDPVSAIRSVRVPVLVMHSADDSVVPIHHGRALFAAANEPRQWLEVKQSQHIEGLAREPVRREVAAAMLSALEQ
ncbi:MAG TPA: alpha/beta hydrolase [Burkholderiaceae bacterium]|nr:alpha/beta hydrolase [Burkholderiaceae bacterium]